MAHFKSCFDCKYQNISTERGEWLVCHCKKGGKKCDVKMVCENFESEDENENIHNSD